MRAPLRERRVTFHTCDTLRGAPCVKVRAVPGIPPIRPQGSPPSPAGRCPGPSATWTPHTLTHINDPSSWLFKGCFGLSAKDTLKTWGLLQLCNSLVGLGMVLLLSLFVG
jgi:GntP family permease